MDYNEFKLLKSNYYEKLDKFVRNNSDKDEIDFLQTEIYQTQEWIKFYENIDINEINNDLRRAFDEKLNFPEFISDERKKSFVVVDLILKKEYLPTKIEVLKEKLRQYSTKVIILNSKKTKSEYPFYCQIGALFSQGFITKKVTKNVGIEYFYKGDSFYTISSLSKHVQENVLKTTKSVRQWIDATLKDDNKEKNFYKNELMYSNTVKYCKKNNIEILEDFKLHK